jgi:tetratricopeptide (TPR) repeat protein
VVEQVGELYPSIPFVVRIKSSTAIGLGFFVDESHIVTCAHVVTDVLDLPDYPSEAPSEALTVDFPFFPAAAELTAHVIKWHPRTNNGGRINDIAGLVLDKGKPVAPPARLLHGRALFDHAFWAFGFTRKYSNGIWSHGKIGPSLPNGRVQVENLKGQGLSVERGFSGTPVWDEELNGVVGMVVEASLREDPRLTDVGEGIAFLMPADVLLEGWPELHSFISKVSAGKEEPQAYIAINEGSAFHNSGRYQEAVASFDKALAIDPRSAAALHYKGNSLFLSGSFEEAIVSFDASLALDPRSVSTLNDKGWALQSRGLFTQAFDCFDKALAIDPRYAPAWYNKAWALINAGRYQEAVFCLDKNIEINPFFSPAWYYKGWILNGLGRSQEAIFCHNQAIAIDAPSVVNALYFQGFSLGSCGRHMEAIDCFDKALAINQLYAPAWYYKGLSLNYLGRFQEAQFCYNRAVAIDPGFVAMASQRRF